FIKSGLTRFHDLAGQLVSIDYRQATGEQELRAGGLAHADSACETKDLHERSEGRRSERNSKSESGKFQRAWWLACKRPAPRRTEVCAGIKIRIKIKIKREAYGIWRMVR